MTGADAFLWDAQNTRQTGKTTATIRLAVEHARRHPEQEVIIVAANMAHVDVLIGQITDWCHDAGVPTNLGVRSVMNAAANANKGNLAKRFYDHFAMETIIARQQDENHLLRDKLTRVREAIQ